MLANRIPGLGETTTMRVATGEELGGKPAHLSENGLPTDPRAPVRVSVVLPCLDEEGGVATAVREALQGLRFAGLSGQIIVVDNGSTDGSAAAAAAAGATVVADPR